MRSDVFGMAKQTTKGTGVFTPEYFVPVEAADMNPNIEILDIVETAGKRFPINPPDLGSANYEVTANGAIRPGALPRLLSGFLGAPTSTKPGTLAYLHSFDAYAADINLILQSLLVGRADPTPKITDWAYDCYGASLELTGTVNDYLKFSGTWNGKSLDTVQTFPAAPTVDSTERFPYQTITCQIGVDGGGLVTVKCREFTLTYTNDIDLDFLALGSQNPYDIGVGNANMTLAITPLETLSTYLRYAYPGATNELKVVLTVTGGLIETGQSNQIVMTAYRGKTTDSSAPVNAGEILKGVPITLQFAKDRTLAKFFDMTVKNAVTSY
jgi:hypothetical protein